MRELDVDVRLTVLVESEDEDAAVTAMLEELSENLAARLLTGGGAAYAWSILRAVPLRDGVLSVRETARRLQVHENTVRNWAKPGGILEDARIPGTRFNRFRARDVDELVTNRGHEKGPL